MYQARPKSRFAVIIDIKVADVFTVVHQLLFGYLPVVLQEPFRITLPDEVIKANLDQTELVRNTASGLVAPTSETQATFFLQQELAGSVIQWDHLLGQRLLETGPQCLWDHPQLHLARRISQEGEFAILQLANQLTHWTQDVEETFQALYHIFEDGYNFCLPTHWSSGDLVLMQSLKAAAVTWGCENLLKPRQLLNLYEYSWNFHSSKFSDLGLSTFSFRPKSIFNLSAK